jgi:signal transduction histidine kinase
LNKLLFIETFVLGSAAIAAIYHFILFIQQRDKFLMYYSAYLLMLAAYIGFKLLSNNYDPFAPTDNVWYFVLEEVLQVSMVTVYVLFAAQTLEVINSKSIVRTLMIAFFVMSFVSIGFHIYDAVAHGPGIKSRNEYAISRISLVGIATLALLFAWRIRTTIFQRTIIIGSLVYDFSGLLSIISFTQERDVFGLNGVEPYLAGCLLDIIIFSSALGYRLKIIASEKNNLLKKELENQLVFAKMRTDIASNLHDDIGSTLSSISIYSEAGKNKIKQNQNESVIELLNRIGINARETMGNMSDIVWAINPINDNGAKLFSKMESFASSLFISKEIALDFNVPDHLFDLNFEMDVRQNLFLILKEAVNNCAKYSNAKKVEIIFKLSNSVFELTIKDDGNGFDMLNVSEGNGLLNMKNRAKDIEGTLTIDSSKKGTIIHLQFPFS